MKLNQTYRPVETDEFAPLPEGWYNAAIEEAAINYTKSGTGQYIKAKYRLDNNRVVFGNINTQNDNAKAEEIGRQQIGQIMRATGLVEFDDTDQLIGLRLQIKLSIKTDDYGTKNEVRGFKALEGSAPPMPAPAPAANDGPPWARK